MFRVAVFAVVVFAAFCTFVYSIVHKEIADYIIPFLIVIFAAFCAFVSGIISAKMASEQENRKDIIRTATSFCDDLMNDSCKYWMSECSDKNKVEMGVLGWRIISYIILINRFLGENFPKNLDIQKAVGQINEFVTGLNFVSESNRKPDTEQTAKAIHYIIQLRLIISKHKEQNYYDYYKETIIKFILKKKVK